MADSLNSRLNRRILYVGIVVVAALVVVVALVINRNQSGSSTVTNTPDLPPVSTTLSVGDRLPTTGSLPELFGSSSSSLGSIRGHHSMVINFFGSYCTACAQEMDNFATVSNSQHSVIFVGVDADEPSLPNARSLVTKAKITYPILVDKNGDVITSPYGVASLPATFFVSASGTIKAEVLGLESVAELRQLIDAL